MQRATESGGNFYFNLLELCWKIVVIFNYNFFRECNNIILKWYIFAELMTKSQASL